MSDLKTRFVRSKHYHFAPSTDLTTPIMTLSTILFSILLKTLVPVVFMIIFYLYLIASGMFSEEVQSKTAKQLEEMEFYASLSEDEREELEMIGKEVFGD